MDTDSLDAPDGWEWIVDDELAHHLWDQTAKTPEVKWGMEPPMILQSLMGFFGDRSMTDARNNWIYTRHPKATYMEETTWERIPSKMQFSDPDDSTTDILYDEEMSPHPLRSQLTGQQYTVTGGLFTYAFKQWQGEAPSGLARIPCPTDLLDDVRNRILELPFEETQYQSREYRAQFADGPTPGGTFAHPHFAPTAAATQADFKDFFTRAHLLMKRGVRVERLQPG
jgi:hypothetical protein